MRRQEHKRLQNTHNGTFHSTTTRTHARTHTRTKNTEAVGSSSRLHALAQCTHGRQGGLLRCHLHRSGHTRAAHTDTHTRADTTVSQTRQRRHPAPARKSAHGNGKVRQQQNDTADSSHSRQCGPPRPTTQKDNARGAEQGAPSPTTIHSPTGGWRGEGGRAPPSTRPLTRRSRAPRCALRGRSPGPQGSPERSCAGPPAVK
jgi:hypothetical protein